MISPGIERVAVVGLGVTGAAVAEVLLKAGVQVRISDAADSAELRQRAGPLQARGAVVALGGHDPAVVEWAEVVIPSKGVPPSNPVLSRALQSGVPVWSEFELAWRMGARRVLAVTGTNGKTTATELLAAMLARSGFRAVPAGNLPVPLIRALDQQGPDSHFVCEASSFGLEFIEEFRPRVAVVLNVADDHYDWHGSYDDYLAAKARITENQTGEDLLAFRVGDSGCETIARSSQARLAPFGVAHPDEVAARSASALMREVDFVGGVVEGRLVVKRVGRVLIEISDIRLTGDHNRENVLGAAIAALDYGAEPRAVIPAAKGFHPLPHRMTLVREVDSVKYIDDSKATNPHATMGAMAGLDRVILIAGGRSRSGTLEPLRAVKDRLRGLVVMGESGPQLEALLGEGPRLPVARAVNVEEAVTLAAGFASAGDTVLLSPACSSLDQYSNYAERGDRFAQAVKQL